MNERMLFTPVTDVWTESDPLAMAEATADGAWLVGVVYEDVIVFASIGKDHEVLRKPRYILTRKLSELQS